MTKLIVSCPGSCGELFCLVGERRRSCFLWEPVCQSSEIDGFCLARQIGAAWHELWSSCLSPMISCSESDSADQQGLLQAKHNDMIRPAGQLLWDKSSLRAAD